MIRPLRDAWFQKIVFQSLKGRVHDQIMSC